MSSQGQAEEVSSSSNTTVAFCTGCPKACPLAAPLCLVGFNQAQAVSDNQERSGSTGGSASYEKAASSMVFWIPLLKCCLFSCSLLRAPDYATMIGRRKNRRPRRLRKKPANQQGSLRYQIVPKKTRKPRSGASAFFNTLFSFLLWAVARPWDFPQRLRSPPLRWRSWAQPPTLALSGPTSIMTRSSLMLATRPKGLRSS